VPGQQRAVTFTIARLPPDLRYDSNTRYYYTLFRLSRESWNWGKIMPERRDARALSTFRKRPPRTQHAPITERTRRYKRHNYVQHRFRGSRWASPPGGQSLPTSCLTPRTPVHEGATGERSTAEHYGQRRTFQTCCPKLPRCHGLWLFAPPRCPVWLPAAGRAGIRLLTHASILQSWRIGVTERLTD